MSHDLAKTDAQSVSYNFRDEPACTVVVRYVVFKNGSLEISLIPPGNCRSTLNCTMPSSKTQDSWKALSLRSSAMVGLLEP
jgi:hypothetical protein